MLVYNAVITTKILYGLDSLKPTDSTGRLLDTFQLKGLRKIVKLHTTFIDRALTNEFVLKRLMKQSAQQAKVQTQKLSHSPKFLHVKDWSYLVTCCVVKDNTPYHQVMFASNRAVSRIPNTRRVGRPRKCWTAGPLRIWRVRGISYEPKTHIMLRYPFDRNNQHIRDKLIEADCAYQPPFDWYQLLKEKWNHLFVKISMWTNKPQCEQISVWMSQFELSQCGCSFLEKKLYLSSPPSCTEQTASRLFLCDSWWADWGQWPPNMVALGGKTWVHSSVLFPSALSERGGHPPFGRGPVAPHVRPGRVWTVWTFWGGTVDQRWGRWAREISWGSPGGIPSGNWAWRVVKNSACPLLIACEMGSMVQPHVQ